MTLYYREKNGDYVEVYHGTRDYYARIGQWDIREARAAAIDNLAESVCTTGVSLKWLRKVCKRVAKRDVPKKWLNWLDPPQCRE